jgi:predicted nucleic acid-binding protein
LTLVIDASLAVEACIAPGGFQALADQTLVAPAIMWSEVRSVLHERRWRGDLTQQQAVNARAVLADAPIARVEYDRIQHVAWELADSFGWAKTYDAEYVALAQLLGCRLITVDGKLRRGAAQSGFVITPADL